MILIFQYFLHTKYLQKEKIVNNWDINEINRLLVLPFELFYIVISVPFIADYAVWGLLIVEGRTVTYSF